MKKIIVNAQWQGGGDLVTYAGANELINMYLKGLLFERLPVTTDQHDMFVKKNGIKGFDALRKQMRSAYDHLIKDAPDTLLTLGGGCDADVPEIVYLSEKYRGDLTVIWLDAHGDLNTPGESASSLFYGMPLRALMDDHCFGLLENRYPLTPPQVIHVGGRDFDEAETAFIKASQIAAYAVSDIRSNVDTIRKIAESIKTAHVYIHLDLDVMDPGVFPNTPLPVDGGLCPQEVWDIFHLVAGQTVGLGVYEYAPSGTKDDFVEKLISFGLNRSIPACRDCSGSRLTACG